MGEHVTKPEISQILYKTACEGTEPKKIADDMEISVRTVRRIIRANRYEIQKRASEFVQDTLDNALQVTKNNINNALIISEMNPSSLSRSELSFQKTIGVPSVDKALEVAGVVGSTKSQSGVTNNFFQQNNTTLSGNVKEFLKGMTDSLTIEEGEVLDAEANQNEKAQAEAQVEIQELDRIESDESGGEDAEYRSGVSCKSESKTGKDS